MLTQKKTRIALTFVILASLITACIPIEQPILERLAEILEGDVFDFHIVELDMETIVDGLGAGSITLPLVDPENRVVELELAARPIQLRAKRLTEGGLRNDKGDIERVALPREQNFRIGECAKPLEKFNGCGSLTILDEARTMIGGILIHEKLGLTFFEPVDGILGGADNPGLHLIYNVTGTETIDFGKGEEPEIRGILPSKSPGLAYRHRQALVFKETSIVLDGDVQFYQINTSTVWARQEEVFNTVSMLYGIIEPLSVESPNTATWGLDLEIKGQEVWVSGGPTTTNGNDLRDEITDPNYFLLNPVNDKELHYLFVGYDVTNLLGKAAGIGSTSGFGGAAGKNHAFGEARSSQSLKTRWVIMAHEVGHLLGGPHFDGVDPGCTTFFFFFQICGTSIMPAGDAGGPSTRSAFFSDANDDNIDDVLNAVLP